MKLTSIQQEEILKRYNDLIIKIENLKNIVQNDIDFEDTVSRRLLIEHKRDTNKTVRELIKLHSDICKEYSVENINMDKILEILNVINSILGLRFKEEELYNRSLKPIILTEKEINKILDTGDKECIAALSNAKTFVNNIVLRRDELLKILKYGF